MIAALPLAHGIGVVKDLPLPLWLFYYTGAIVLVVSFVALSVLWTKPRLEDNHWERPLPGWLQRILLSTALRVLLSAFAFGLLVLVFLAALIGEPSQGANLAPTFVFVIFWVGMVPLVVVFGNVWRVLNPWRAAADGVAWLSSRLGVSWEPLARYPERLGRWPAAAPAVRLHRLRAGLPRRVRAALARARDPDLQLDHLGRRGGLRARHVVRELRRVHALLRLPVAHRPLRRQPSGRGGGRSS